MNGARFSFGAVVTGLLFMVLGVIFAVSAYAGWDIAPEVLWPSLLIGAGVVVVAGGLAGTRGAR